MGFAKAVSPDGKLFVYTLTQGGTDWVIAHFVNVTSGIELEDKLEFILWPDFTWMPDGLGLFYSVMHIRSLLCLDCGIYVKN